MIETIEDWRDYQEQVARCFRDAGCDVSVEATVEGARGTHKVDVLVEFDRYGVRSRWIVECKLWTSAVPKEKVMALKAIVEDTGADRGILFSESGFQKGAQLAARSSNITLQKGLEDFRETAVINSAIVRLRERKDYPSEATSFLMFPNNARPHTLLLHDENLYVGSWGTGSILNVNLDTLAIEATIDLDRYESRSSADGQRSIGQSQPGNMAYADGRIFVGQVFSDHVLAIDCDTQSIVKRVAVPGGGQGSLCASSDGRQLFFASNTKNCFFEIDSATYSISTVSYPHGGRGAGCILAHPTKPLLYIGIQRGGRRNGKPYPFANSFLATYDLEDKRYSGYLNLDRPVNGRTDDAIPAALTIDEKSQLLYVGMFQSMLGIVKADEDGTRILGNLPFEPNAYCDPFPWTDPIAQSIYGSRLISVNRNNRELAEIDADSFSLRRKTFLGDAANGPSDVIIHRNRAIVSYPELGGLVLCELSK